MGILRGKELSKGHLVKHGFVARLGRHRHRLRLGLLIADFNVQEQANVRFHAAYTRDLADRKHRCFVEDLRRLSGGPRTIAAPAAETRKYHHGLEKAGLEEPG